MFSCEFYEIFKNLFQRTPLDDGLYFILYRNQSFDLHKRATTSAQCKFSLMMMIMTMMMMMMMMMMMTVNLAKKKTSDEFLIDFSHSPYNGTVEEPVIMTF